MDVLARPVGPFKHTRHYVAVGGKNLLTHGANTLRFTVGGVAVGAAVELAHPFGNVSRPDSALKNNAFDELAFFQKAPADGAGFKGGAVRVPSSAEKAPLFPGIAGSAADKKGTARQQRQHQIRNEYSQKKEQGVEEYQFTAALRGECFQP